MKKQPSESWVPIKMLVCLITVYVRWRRKSLVRLMMQIQAHLVNFYTGYLTGARVMQIAALAPWGHVHSLNYPSSPWLWCYQSWKCQRRLTRILFLCLSFINKSFKGSATHYHNYHLSPSVSHSVSHSHSHTNTHIFGCVSLSSKNKAGTCRVVINFSEWLQTTDVSLLFTLHSTFRCCVAFVWSSIIKSVFIRGGLSLLLRDSSTKTLESHLKIFITSTEEEGL